MKQPNSVKDMGKHPGEPLAQINHLEQIPLPPPFDKIDEEPEFAQLSDAAREKYVVLDDTIADAEIYRMIDDSYDLVVQGLPKAKRSVA